MKSQTEEMLWIATQEDQLIPIDIIRHITSKQISLSKLFDFTVDELPTIEAKSVRKFFDRAQKIDEKKCQNIWNSIQSSDISLITYEDMYFPEKLKKLVSNKTVILYHKGTPIPFENCIAIVGTRDCSTYAAEFTRELSQKVAQAGYTVVAGLALGIDTIAHRGALRAGGKTIAVLPWMFNPTPKSNRKLLDEIMHSGFAISDTYFNTEGMMAKGKFVHRNEIISGISDILVAVESGITGGTTHQVEIALRQGRPVITLEPEIDNEHAYKGFEKFVKMGAIAVKSVDDALELIKSKKLPKPSSPNTTLLEFSSS